MSNILITQIKIDGTNYCLQDSGFTVPILSGASTTGAKMPTVGRPLSGDNIFNLYQDNPTGIPGSDDGYGTTTGSAPGGIKFGVHPCANEIQIKVVGKRDIYESTTPFDTCAITIDSVQVFFRQNTGANSINFNSSTSKYVPALSGTDSFTTTFTHTFSTDVPCGHIVNITGQPGAIANNNVGYDIQILSVTVPT